MNKYLMIFTVVISFLLSSLPIQAGTSDVHWENPDKYRDIHSGDEPKANYRKRIFKDLEKHFAQMATDLPEGHRLNVTVTDVDLAGDVNAGGIDRLRIISNLYFPRLKFKYELFDATGLKIKAGGINLKDMSFMMGSNMRYRNKSLGYEKRMLDKWFNNTFEDVVEKVSG